MELRLQTGYRQILGMALPISLAMLVPQINFITNNIFLGGLGENELASAGITGVYYLIFAVIGNGLNNGLQALIARRAGQNLPKEIGKLFYNGVWVALGIGVETISDNRQAISKSEVIIVALKPYNVKEVLEELKDDFDPSRHIVISVVTGIFLDDLSSILDHGVPIFRAMPNTAIAIQESVTCLCHQGASAPQVNYVTELFGQLGIAITIDEKLMDAATVLGACGIAYALRFIRASTQGGIEIGFDAKTANLIAAQTVKGAAELLLKLNRHPEEEIDKVTTPKGCTIAGLNEMEHQGFSSSLIKGICTSFEKIGK